MGASGAPQPDEGEEMYRHVRGVANHIDGAYW